MSDEQRVECRRNHNCCIADGNKNRPVVDKLNCHSSRGIQYACSAFSNLLAANKWVYRSMS